MDTEYLKASVGQALSTGIAETVLMRPDDPVDYLAQRLLKWVEDGKATKVHRQPTATATCAACMSPTPFGTAQDHRGGGGQGGARQEEGRGGGC